VGIPWFLLGRQLVVVPCGFLIANVTAFGGYEEEMGPVLYSIIVGFSLPIVLFSIMLTQLAPQIFAGRHTECFLRMPGALLLIKVCLWISRLGVTLPAEMFCTSIAKAAGLEPVKPNAVSPIGRGRGRGRDGDREEKLAGSDSGIDAGDGTSAADSPSGRCVQHILRDV